MRTKIIRGPWSTQKPQSGSRWLQVPTDRKLMQHCFRRAHRDRLYRAQFVRIYRSNMLEDDQP